MWGFVLYLFLMVGGVSGQGVEQPAKLMSVEGTFARVNCTYSTSGFNGLSWYQQYEGQAPVFLSYVVLDGLEDSGHFSTFLSRSDGYSYLLLTELQIKDSASYLCAHMSNYNVLYFGSGTQLIVKPNIKDPEPAVYQLKDPQFKNGTLCLFTDFDSQANVMENTVSAMFVSNKTVLDMKATDSKSNGLIAWSTEKSFTCKGAFKVDASFPSSDVPCDAKLIEKSFETDMNLNFQNLSVMGLRILLLKVAGFNLLMTLRLWSS